ncbi:uncharacterized protein LOC119011158 isoform X3 [Acanthopagrus latus]|uniref:uncharacterized protein LOC119011158 isoform X3 n=1 Tax=Acanthopagrus latus TaxID=8177 RepID=UPI00187CD7BF|nr:uncharacterized protein LOC119011158 isoform X3 [Acanthopagrus latus]
MIHLYFKKIKAYEKVQDGRLTWASYLASVVGLQHAVWTRLLQVRCGLTGRHVHRVDQNVPRLPWFVSRCIIGSGPKHLQDSEIFSKHFHCRLCSHLNPCSRPSVTDKRTLSRKKQSSTESRESPADRRLSSRKDGAAYGEEGYPHRGPAHQTTGRPPQGPSTSLPQQLPKKISLSSRGEQRKGSREEMRRDGKRP